jgi:hypothetical protein
MRQFLVFPGDNRSDLWRNVKGILDEVVVIYSTLPESRNFLEVSKDILLLLAIEKWFLWSLSGSTPSKMFYYLTYEMTSTRRGLLLNSLLSPLQ